MTNFIKIRQNQISDFKTNVSTRRKSLQDAKTNVSTRRKSRERYIRLEISNLTQHSHSHNEKHVHEDRGYDSGSHSPDSKKSGFSLASFADSTQSADINVRAAMVHVLGDLLQLKLKLNL